MLTIFETSYWKVKHRSDSRYPGFLIVMSKSNELEVNKLDEQALAELGNFLARTENLLLSFFKPYRVIVLK